VPGDTWLCSNLKAATAGAHSFTFDQSTIENLAMHSTSELIPAFSVSGNYLDDATYSLTYLVDQVTVQTNSGVRAFFFLDFFESTATYSAITYD